MKSFWTDWKAQEGGDVGGRVGICKSLPVKGKAQFMQRHFFVFFFYQIIFNLQMYDLLD